MEIDWVIAVLAYGEPAREAVADAWAGRIRRWGWMPVAEALKITVSEQPGLLPLVRPVMEKVASIAERHIRAAQPGKDVNLITMVGGSSAFLGMAEVVQDYIEVPTRVVSHPLFVTPLGLALHDPPQ